MLLAGSARGDILPPVQTAFVVLLENCPWSSIKDSPSAPYLNKVLLPMSSYCSQYYNPSNFTCSLLSYLWLEAGTAFGMDSDSPDCDAAPAINHQSTTNHLVSQLNRAGISWRTYQEDALPDRLLFEDYNLYVVRHNPFVYFDDTTGTNNPLDPYGLAHIRPYSELASDLTNNTVARYNFITPNVCHDMHDSCSPLNNPIQQGDTWLASEIPKLLQSSAYSNNGAVFITWDDPSTSTVVPIGMVVLSPLARGSGYVSTNLYTHSSTLRTLQEIFNVTPYLGAAATATNLSDLFVPGNTNPPGIMRITGLALWPGNELQLTVTGLFGNAPLLLERSTNLVSWNPIATNFASGGTPPAATITNTEAGTLTPGYYRFRQPLP